MKYFFYFEEKNKTHRWNECEKQHFIILGIMVFKSVQCNMLYLHNIFERDVLLYLKIYKTSIYIH